MQIVTAQEKVPPELQARYAEERMREEQAHL
jgi:hypothetical protein